MAIKLDTDGYVEIHFNGKCWIAIAHINKGPATNHTKIASGEKEEVLEKATKQANMWMMPVLMTHNTWNKIQQA